MGEDGVTHHGLFDLAYLRCIPSICVAAPADERTLRNLMFTSLKMDSPLAIRYPRGKASVAEWQTPLEEIEIGKARCVRASDGAETAILALGPAVRQAERAAELLSEKGVAAAVYDMIWLKPLDKELLVRLAEAGIETVVTVEDGAASGGLGSAVSEWAAGYDGGIRVVCLGTPDKWVAQGTPDELWHECGYDSDGIAKAVEETIKGRG